MPVVVADEFATHNLLIPQDSKLSATVMFEINDPVRRSATSARLGGVENHAFLDMGGVRVRGMPDPTRENTSRGGKALSMQLLKFDFAPTEIVAFKAARTAAVVGFDHPNYGHMAVFAERVRAALAQDFG